MQIIKWSLETNMNGADWDGEFEIEDDATDEEIDQYVRDEISNYISWGWRKATDE